MSFRLLRLAVALSQPSGPTYLPVKVEQRRRRRVKIAFSAALATTVLFNVVSSAVEVQAPPPRDSCTTWATGHAVVCDEPLTLPAGIRGRR